MIDGTPQPAEPRVHGAAASRRTSLVIGTRGSRLATWQAEWIQARLQELVPNLRITLCRIKTSGDKILDAPLAKIGGKGLFVKEIEEALLAREVDLAVHSIKDVPAVLPEGLTLVCLPPREDPRDVLISCRGFSLHALPPGASIGTSSLRRQAQLLHVRPDLRIQMLRGNVDTRLRKLKEGEYDAIVLAAAAVRRMGWEAEVTEYLSPELCLPAIGQGAIGVEARADDGFIREVLAPLHDRATDLAVSAERAVLHRLEGGCQVPIAGHAVLHGDRLRLDALIASTDGRNILREHGEAPLTRAGDLGREVAERLLRRGGEGILRGIYGAG